MPRLFTGIEIPEEIRSELSALEMPIPGVDWIDEDNLHVTLRFFGDISDAQARDVTDLLQTMDADAFNLKIAGLGTFGTEPHTLYASVESNPGLEALARANERAARGAGLPAAKRPFKPHVTLARLRYADPVKLARLLSVHARVAFEPVFVHRFALFSSKPRTGGGPYVVEELYPLRGGLGAGEDEDGNPW
jgi:RNA 2',3'-cyclic 3'-phosphodiesterase